MGHPRIVVLRFCDRSTESRRERGDDAEAAGWLFSLSHLPSPPTDLAEPEQRAREEDFGEALGRAEDTVRDVPDEHALDDDQPPVVPVGRLGSAAVGTRRGGATVTISTDRPFDARRPSVSLHVAPSHARARGPRVARGSGLINIRRRHLLGPRFARPRIQFSDAADPPRRVDVRSSGGGGTGTWCDDRPAPWTLLLFVLPCPSRAT